MKVTMSQKTLLESLKRGALAAMSDEAQVDTNALSTLVKSVKIKVEEEEIIFESATALITSRYVLPVTDEITVKSTGEIMVPAKELFDWSSMQTNCMIGLRLKVLDNPETINESGNAETVSKAAITKTGKVEIISQDASKTGSKWSLDSYDPSQVPMIEFDVTTAPLFEVPLEQVTKGVSKIGSSAMQKDGDHLFDAISFQHKDNDMHIIATDCARCATYRLSNADKITLKSSMLAEDITNEEVDFDMTKAWEHNLLVPHKHLSSICKLASDVAPISFYRDEKANRIYVGQPGFIVRLATAEKEKIANYPPLDLFLVKPYKELCALPKGILISRLNTVSMVNKEAILFGFKGDQLTLDAVSEGGKSPCRANVAVPDLVQDFKRVWNVKHVLSVLKAIKDDEVQIRIADDEDQDSMKIVAESEPNVAYYVMAVERSKYDLSDKD